MSAPLCDCVTFGPCPWHHEDMETDTTIPSILEYQLRKSVELTDLRGAASARRIPPQLLIEKQNEEQEGDTTGHSCGKVDDLLPRLKKLLADTKQMVVRAEALVAALKTPTDYYRGQG